jgi:GT2 family glycosyltransferase
MEETRPKIGIGITTYNRDWCYKQCLSSIPRGEIDLLVIVNDGLNHYVNDNDGDIVIKNSSQEGVSKSKNKALKELIEKGIEHIFLIEDDILIKNKNVFKEYIKAAQSTGIHHLCFEKIAGNEKTLKYTLEQPDGVKIGFYHNPQGAFMYVNANLIKKLGYFDENYINAFEHIDFAYNLIKKNVAPPFWYFPDLLNSEDYLEEIKGSSEDSSITNKEGYKENWNRSAEYFIQKWGHFTNAIPDVGTSALEYSLMQLQNNYSRKYLVNKGHKLSLIIPYRQREEALKTIIPALEGYLPKQIQDYEIIVVEQNDDQLFNKGLLNNIGFLLTEDSDYVCFHDVDLIPQYSDYSYPTRPCHLSTFCSQFNYIETPDAIMGGVNLFTKEDFKKINGYPISYIGWGGEDNNLHVRCQKKGMEPYKHKFGRYYSVPHTHRLSNPKEMEKHLINGKKTEDLRNDKVDMFEDGLAQVDLNNFEIILEFKSNYKHYKIKLK